MVTGQMVNRAVPARSDVISYQELIKRAEARECSYQGMICSFKNLQVEMYEQNDAEEVYRVILPRTLEILRNMTWLDRDIRNDIILYFLNTVLRRFITPNRNSIWRGKSAQNHFENCVHHDGWLVLDNQGFLSQILHTAGNDDDPVAYDTFREAMSRRDDDFLDAYNPDQVFDEVFAAYRDMLVVIANHFENEKQASFGTFRDYLFSCQNDKRMGRFVHTMIHRFFDDLVTRLQARKDECAYEAKLWKHRKSFAMYVLSREIPIDVARNIWDRVRQSVDESKEMRAINIPSQLA